MHHLLFADTTAEGFDAVMGSFRENSKAFNSKILHVLIDTNTEESGHVMEFFSITKEDGVTVRIVDVSTLVDWGSKSII